MPNSSRLEQKEKLLFQLGLLVYPIKEAIEAEEPPVKLLPLLQAKFEDDLPAFFSICKNFCTVDGLFLRNEYNWIAAEVRRLIDCLGPLRHQEIRSEAARCLERTLAQVIDRLNNVPVDVGTGILSAKSPFQAYLELRTLLACSKMCLVIADPFLDTAVFHRYLAEVPAEVTITLILKTPSKIDKPANARLDRVLAVASIFEAERPGKVRVFSSNTIHDRTIRVDDTVLHVGGSLKEAGKASPYTISTLQNQETARQALDDLISNSTLIELPKA